MRIYALALSSFVVGCAVSSPLPTASSTQGITVVQMAQVTAIGTMLTLVSENGETHSYAAEPGEVFRVGDRVKIISNNGNIRIAR